MLRKKASKVQNATPGRKHIFKQLTARLKPSPFKSLHDPEFFSSLLI